MEILTCLQTVFAAVRTHVKKRFLFVKSFAATRNQLINPSVNRPSRKSMNDDRMFSESLAGSRVNTPHVAVTFVGWHVYMQVFLEGTEGTRFRGNTLRVRGNTLRCPRTKGTAVTEWFLPNPFIHDLFRWRSSYKFVKTDLYPLSLMSLWNTVCSAGASELATVLVVRKKDDHNKKN